MPKFLHTTRSMNQSRTLSILLILLFQTPIFAALSVKTIHHDAYTIEIQATITLKKNDFLYKDYISFSVDNPHITLSDWRSSVDPISRYDTKFKNTKKIFVESPTLTLTAHHSSTTPLTNAHLHLSYYTHLKRRITEKIIPLTFFKSTSINSYPLLPPINLKNTDTEPTLKPVHYIPISPFKKQMTAITTHATRIIEWPYTVLIFIALTGVLGLFLIGIKKELRPFNLLKQKNWIATLHHLFIIMTLMILFYYARNVVSPHIWVSTLALLCAITGIACLYLSTKRQSLKTYVGIALITGSCIFAFYACKLTCVHHSQFFFSSF